MQELRQLERAQGVIHHPPPEIEANAARLLVRFLGVK